MMYTVPGQIKYLITSITDPCLLCIKPLFNTLKPVACRQIHAHKLYDQDNDLYKTIV